MQMTNHSLPELFAQLGLPDDESAIRDFAASHRPLSGDIHLPDAPFWTPSQARFLREEFLEDADWVEVVDQLNLMLRA